MGISQKVLKRCGLKCYYCHCAVIPYKISNQTDRMATIDHLIPINRGGTKKRDSLNCVIACYSCNNAKASRTVDEIRRDGWKPGNPVKRREIDMRYVFKSISIMKTPDKVMRKSYRRSFSALEFALLNHVDILV